MKLNKTNLLLIRANKAIKNAYSLNRDLSEAEIILEAKNALKDWDDNCFLDNMDWINKLDKKEWEEIAKIGS